MSDQLSLFDKTDTAEAPPSPSPVADADRDARIFAQDPEHNVVLEASAGTGKTSVLVARYVNLLTRGVDPANILAITFTRKAAAEMRERIIRDLRRAAEQATFDRSRWLMVRDRLADIQISTIDAFCLSLLREFPLEADLDPGFTLADETEVPRLMEQSLDKALAIFIGRAKREPDLALVLAQLGLNRTREGLAHLLDRRLVAWDVLDRFLARGPADLTAEVVCGRAVQSLTDLFAALPGGLARFLDDGPVLHPRFQIVGRDLRRLDEFREADNASVRGLIDRVSAHFLTGAGKRRASERIHPYVTDHYPNAAAGKRHRAAALTLSAPVENIVRAFARDLNVVLARGIRRMFAIALAQYRIALDERSVLDFSDVLERAVDLLGRMDEFSQSRFRLEGRYHHVLVDEFQDTSRKQWELVSLLVKAWGEGLGVATQPSIFIVGDRKQSIYRFRDADVTVLEDAAGFIDALRPGGTARRSITRSFRAVPELLAFVNDVFSAMGPASADDGESNSAAAPQTAAKGSFRYGENDRFPIDADFDRERGSALGIATADDPVVCASIVAAEIRRILRQESVRDRQTGIARRASPGDIAILFRSRTSHREFEQALEAQGIPTYVYKGLGFFDADEIKDLSALIRFLANPSSELRAAAFLRSRFVRVSDEALAILAPHFAAVLTDPVSSAVLDRLQEDDRLALEQARAQVPRWIAQVDRVPPADLIEEIIPESAYAYELRGPRFAQAWENVKKMRGLIRRIQNRGYATLARIADHLDSLTAGDESNAVIEALDAVNLMTIHAAKGLEFPIVFVVNLARGATGPPKPVRVAGDDVSVGPFASDTDDEEKRREKEETKRLLYVALTRARDRLYLASVLKEGVLVPGRGSLAEVLPESVRALFGRASAVVNGSLTWTAESGRVFEFHSCSEASGDAPERSSSRSVPFVDRFDEVPHARLMERQTATGSSNDQARPDAFNHAEDRIVGSIVHKLFQFDISPDANLTGDDLAGIMRDTLSSGELDMPADLLSVADRALRAWTTIKARADVAAVLAGAERFHEVPFSLVVPGEPPRIVRGSIDCLACAPDGSVTVLEFKTGRPRPDHQAQLDLYVRAAREMFPGAPVEGRLIYPT